MDSSETSAVTLESKGHRDETMQTGCITQRFWMLSHFRSVATLDFERSFSLQSVSVGHCCELFSVTHCGFPRTPVNISAVVCQSEKNLNEFWPNEFEFNEWMNWNEFLNLNSKKGVKIITFEVSSQMMNGQSNSWRRWQSCESSSLTDWSKSTFYCVCHCVMPTLLTVQPIKTECPIIQ